MRLLIVAAFSALALTACKSNCRQLSERLCECAINSVEKDTCLRTAAAAEGTNAGTPDSETICANLLKPADGGVGCDCRLIDTKEGKIRCGLARSGEPATPAPAGDAGP